MFLSLDNTPSDERLFVQNLTLIAIANKTLADGFQEIYANWTKPSEFSGVYFIEWKNDSTGEMGNDTTNATEYRISGLHACTIYNVTVSASYNNGTIVANSSSTSTYFNCKSSYQTKYLL